MEDPFPPEVIENKMQRTTQVKTLILNYMLKFSSRKHVTNDHSQWRESIPIRIAWTQSDYCCKKISNNEQRNREEPFFRLHVINFGKKTNKQ